MVTRLITLSSCILFSVIRMIYITLMVFMPGIWQNSSFSHILQAREGWHFSSLNSDSKWKSWEKFLSSMDLIWDFRRGKSWFFSLGTGTRQLMRKQSIICPNIMCSNWIGVYLFIYLFFLLFFPSFSFSDSFQTQQTGLMFSLALQINGVQKKKAFSVSFNQVLVFLSFSCHVMFLKYFSCKPYREIRLNIIDRVDELSLDANVP